MSESSLIAVSAFLTIGFCVVFAMVVGICIESYQLRKSRKELKERKTPFISEPTKKYPMQVHPIQTKDKSKPKFKSKVPHNKKDKRLNKKMLGSNNHLSNHMVNPLDPVNIISKDIYEHSDRFSSFNSDSDSSSSSSSSSNSSSNSDSGSSGCD